MDLKLAKLKAVKQQAKEQNIVTEAVQCMEKSTGLILRPGSRMIKEDDLDIATRNREFIPIERIDTIIEQNGFASTHAFFTIGVLIESSGLIKTKNGKALKVLKYSDMIKYDILKVK
jgi:hypothetical protein